MEQVYLAGFPLRHATFSASSGAGGGAATGARAGAGREAGDVSFLHKAYSHYLSRHLLPTRPEQGHDLHSVASDLSLGLDSMASGDAWLHLDTLPGPTCDRAPTCGPGSGLVPAPAPPVSADSALLRRAEVLLRAEYVLTGACRVVCGVVW